MSQWRYSAFIGAGMALTVLISCGGGSSSATTETPAPDSTVAVDSSLAFDPIEFGNEVCVEVGRVAVTAPPKPEAFDGDNGEAVFDMALYDAFLMGRAAIYDASLSGFEYLPTTPESSDRYSELMDVNQKIKDKYYEVSLKLLSEYAGQDKVAAVDVAATVGPLVAEINELNSRLSEIFKEFGFTKCG